MLTADHVHARRRKGDLKLTPLKPEQRARALVIATELHELALAHVGQTREELTEAWRGVKTGARERKLALGIRKLIEDGLRFEVDLEADPVALRREVFELSTARRKELAPDVAFDRDGLLAEVAARRGLTAEQVERGLYADLKHAHRLIDVSGPPPAAIVAHFDLEQARAVLLRAVRVRVHLRGATAGALRTLFRKLKFQRLLYEIRRDPDGSVRVDIDGPFSLFESVTKYGLALAIALPSIAACGRWSLEADVRWGKVRSPLRFALEGDAIGPAGEGAPDRLPDEVEALRERFAEGRAGFVARSADTLLDLPGVGLCVPDLVFEHQKTGEVVYLEVMGFWSRDAVWKRVELVEAGLPHKVLFAVSRRLRVSEAVLPDEATAALYVYKGTMSAKQIELKLKRLVGG